MRSTANYMSREDFELVVKAIPDLGIKKWEHEDIIMLFKVLYWCALRFSEGVKLRYEDVDLQRCEIRLGKTKTEKAGVAVIPDVFMDELTDWLAGREMGRLWDGLSYNTAIRWIYKLGEMLDIEAWKTPEKISGEKTKSHIFRKSIGKDMLSAEKRAPLNVISRHLRHKNINTTEKYLNVGNEAVKDYFDV